MIPRGDCWSEKEIKVTISSYFEILKVQEHENSTPKNEFYKKLNQQYPVRSIKAFEANF